MFTEKEAGIMKNIIDSARTRNNLILTEIESKKVLSEAGIGVVDTKLANSEKAAVSIADEMGYPVVLKISSPDITHKSDIGGVRVGLKNQEDVIKAYGDIIAAAKARYPEAVIEGVSVQQMARPGTEIIIGMTKDPQFGPVLMFGLGGIFVELLKDVSFRIVPLSRYDAKTMIKEIRGYTLLNGYRGSEPADIGALEEMLLKISDFAERNPEIKEMDLNPVFAYKQGAIAIDARIVLEP
jgi:acetate---CoA ligase (ADP-forming) subunit beta